MSKEIMQDVFNWRFDGTGQDEMFYTGEYYGVEVGMLIETCKRKKRQLCSFVRIRRSQYGRTQAGHFDTAAELLASFPAIHDEYELAPV